MPTPLKYFIRMVFLRFKLRRTSVLFIFALIFITAITLIHKSVNQDGSWWTEFASEDGIREGQLVVLQNTQPDEPMLRIIHLDLKGAPPKVNYLRQLLPVLAQAGCNALLVEYEDMFPYHGLLANISAKNAYTTQQIMDFLSWSHDLGMEVIPLVQTFGHLEFVLKLEEFRYLRELDAFPQELCPSNPDSMNVVQEMLRQVLSLHRSAKYIHIGCDEVFHLAMCNRCIKRRMDSREIFSKHVTDVALYLKSSYPGITPLIWDDMMRQWNPQFLSSTPLGNLVEPVVWVYTSNIQKLIPHYIWHWYTKTFKNIWVAGAFKGATLSTSVLPDMRNHFENQKSWLDFILRSTKKIKGYVLTGWSRYDHFAILCELLPASFPSLLLNLLTISSRNPESHQLILKNWVTSMKCSPSSDVTIDSLATLDPRTIGSCSFTGLDAYILMNNYLNLKNRVDWLNTYLTERRAWMTPYNVKHNFASPMRLIEGYTETNGVNLLREVQTFKNETTKILSRYFDSFTVKEWVEQRVEPLENTMDTLAKQMETLMKIGKWPRRPLSTS